jgi:hypothetical protein
MWKGPKCSSSIDVESEIEQAMNFGFQQRSDIRVTLNKEEDVIGRLVKELVEWSVSKGGYFHPNVEIRRFDPHDPKSYFGAFVKGTIGVNATLMKIPGSTKLQLSSKKHKHLSYNTQVCNLAWLLKEEYDKGNASEYLPYINYVKAQTFGQIPAMWSPSGQHLLLRVQGDLYVKDDRGFVSPKRIVNWIDSYFETKCLNKEDENDYLNPFFVAMAIQRGFDIALIPVYDMLSGSEGKINSITRPSVHDKNGFGVYALQNLTQGDELFFSYFHCPDCGTTNWGTPEMLRDFGFVEQYPQTFYLDEGVTLYVDEDKQNGGYKAWCKKRCPHKAFVELQLKRLRKVLKDDITTAKPYLPANEYNIIRQYHKAWTTAFKTVLPHASPDSKEFLLREPGLPIV